MGAEWGENLTLGSARGRWCKSAGLLSSYLIFAFLMIRHFGRILGQFQGGLAETTNDLLDQLRATPLSCFLLLIAILACL